MGFLSRAYRTPMTTLTLIVLAMVFAGTEGWRENEASSELRRAWGTVERLTWVSTGSSRPQIWYEQLYGPFQLWDGEWWRIPISGFHHAGFWHLFLNSLFLATYGAILEVHWGPWRTGCFLLGAVLVALLPDYLLENYAVGFSGVGCAIFGALCALRRYRTDIEQQISLDHVAGMLTALVVMWLWTEMGLLQIANMAHLTGLAYGALAGAVAGIPWAFPGAVKAGFVCAHLVLVGPYWLATHPVWNGRFHWYLATRTPEGKPQIPTDMALLRRAVACDPTLSPVWILLADDAQRQGRPLDAWNCLLRGLQYQPTNSDLLQSTRKLWRRIVATSDRLAAREAVARVFGDRADAWLKQIRHHSPPPILIAPDQPPTTPSRPTVELFRPEWTPANDPWWWRSEATQMRAIPDNDPRSASEGELL